MIKALNFYFKHIKRILLQCGNVGSVSGLGRSPGEGDGYPFQYSCLENSMDREAQQATVHGVAKSRTRLSNFPFTFHFHALEKEMATHSHVLAWRIPWTEGPVGLWSMGFKESDTTKQLTHTHTRETTQVSYNGNNVH